MEEQKQQTNVRYLNQQEEKNNSPLRSLRWGIRSDECELPKEADQRVRKKNAQCCSKHQSKSVRRVQEKCVSDMAFQNPSVTHYEEIHMNEMIGTLTQML